MVLPVQGEEGMVLPVQGEERMALAVQGEEHMALPVQGEGIPQAVDLEELHLSEKGA